MYGNQIERISWKQNRYTQRHINIFILNHKYEKRASMQSNRKIRMIIYVNNYLDLWNHQYANPKLKNKQTKLQWLFEEERPVSSQFSFVLIWFFRHFCLQLVCSVLVQILCVFRQAFAIFFLPVFLHRCIGGFNVIFLCISGYTLCLDV